MKRIAALLAAVVIVCGLLSGCDLWMSGEYLSVTPHDEQTEQAGDVITQVASYNQLRNVLAVNVASCVDKIIVSLSSFNEATVDFYIQTAINNVLKETPVGAYAVKQIDYEVGTSRGEPVVVFNMTYRFASMDILTMHKVRDSENVKELALDALQNKKDRVVLFVEDYTETNIEETVENYMLTHGDQLVEVPRYRISLFPEKGAERIVEMIFAYGTDKQLLKEKQEQLEKVLLEAESSEKYTQVLDFYEGYYAFLSKHATYVKESSSTPVYNLLCERKGDSRAFAMTFAALCRRADLECVVISGTYNSEHRYWNLVRFRGVYYHLDILACMTDGNFVLKPASEMSGYQWDTEKYPVSE